MTAVNAQRSIIGLRRRWDRQPEWPVVLDYSHPLSYGFIHPKAFFYLLGQGNVDATLYSGSNPTNGLVYDVSGNNNNGKQDVGFSGFGQSEQGAGMSFISGGTRINTNFLIDSTINGEGTVYWAQQPSTAFNDGNQRFMWGANTSGSAPEFSAQKFTDNKLYVGWNGFSGDNRVTIANTAQWWSTDRVNHWAFTWKSGTKARLYNNGLLIGTASSNSNVGAFSGSNTFQIVAIFSTSNVFTGTMLYCGLSSKQHDDGMVYDMAQAPFQMFPK